MGDLKKDNYISYLTVAFLPLVYKLNSHKNISYSDGNIFAIKEIIRVIDTPNNVLQSALESRIEKLKGKKTQIEYLIGKT